VLFQKLLPVKYKMNFTQTSMLGKSSFQSRQRRTLNYFGESLERPQEKFPGYLKDAKKLNYGLTDSSLRRLFDQVKSKINIYLT